MRLTIKAKVFSLALIPPLLIAVFLTWYNLSQSTQVAQNAVSDFKSQMETDAREEVRNYLQLAMSSIEHLVLYKSAKSARNKFCASFASMIPATSVTSLFMTMKEIASRTVLTNLWKGRTYTTLKIQTAFSSFVSLLRPQKVAEALLSMTGKIPKAR